MSFVPTVNESIYHQCNIRILSSPVRFWPYLASNHYIMQTAWEHYRYIHCHYRHFLYNDLKFVGNCLNFLATQNNFTWSCHSFRIKIHFVFCQKFVHIQNYTQSNPGYSFLYLSPENITWGDRWTVPYFFIKSPQKNGTRGIILYTWSNVLLDILQAYVPSESLSELIEVSFMDYMFVLKALEVVLTLVPWCALLAGFPCIYCTF